MEEGLVLVDGFVEFCLFVVTDATPRDQVLRLLDNPDRVDLQATDLERDSDDSRGVRGQLRPG
jgi:hypothetical protein